MRLKDKNIQKFRTRFPWLNKESCLANHRAIDVASVGDGWFKLIWDLCIKIDKDLEKYPRPKFHVCQVKQKIGELRYYADYGSEAIYSAIQKATVKSRKVCEVCGKPGKLRTSFLFMQTLCKKHCDEYLKKTGDLTNV